MIICDTIANSPLLNGNDPFGPRVEAARKAGSMNQAVDETMQRWFGDEWIRANPDEASRVRSLMQQTTLDGFETCCAALQNKSFDNRPLFGNLAKCVERVKLVVGENDADLPKVMGDMRTEVQKGFDEAGKNDKVELVIIPKAGHVSFIDGYEDFIKAVLPFLKE